MGTVTKFIAVGADVGQRVDPSAVVVAEAWRATVADEVEGERETGQLVFAVRHAGRLPLGSPYPAVAKRVAEVAHWAQHRVGTRIPLRVAVDVTGVGAPVFELIEQELAAAGVEYVSVAATFTHGDRLDERLGEARVGKAYLVSRLQSLLQTDRVQLPRTPEAEALARELLDYEIRVDDDANDRYGAFRVGSHDDLATALGLACLTDWPESGGIRPLEGPARRALEEFYNS